MAAQPVIVEAPSNRSKCKACHYLGGDDPTIAMGSKRVGIPGHAAGVTVYHWCKPACFAKHCLRVDMAPSGRAKCKADGEIIAKGSLRLLVGYKKESTIYRLENAQRTIVPELISLVGRSTVVIHGLSKLSLDDRLRAEGYIFGDGSSKKKQSATKPAAAKKKRGADATSSAAAAARKKPKKKRQEEEEEEDGELVD